MDAALDELPCTLDELCRTYEEICARNLTLNMARGKPSAAQLDLSMQLFDTVPGHEGYCAADGTDCRNYGVLAGLSEARTLMAILLDDVVERVIVCGNSSLNIEYDTLAHCWMRGTCGSKPWCELNTVRWICPTPGYDRHFAITESFGIEMINVAMDGNGPDMNEVERLVAEDSSIKGIWCVPQYSNPTGTTYSDEVVNRLAAMPCAAQDFRIFWDNAYSVHHLYRDNVPCEHVRDIAQACEQAGNPERYYKFASTSKITFPGAGISGIAASEANIADILERMNAQTIGYNKLNQLAHVRFLKDAAHLDAHMRKHAQIIRPKFDIVLEALEANLAHYGCSWSNPEGGYFICFEGPANTASRIVELAADAGVILTGAGAPFPYGKDPNDSVIRLAPTLPNLDELETAMQVFCLCARIACLEKEA